VTRDRGRRGDAAADVELPRALPGLRVHGEHHARVVREVEPAVGDRGRELEQLARAEEPDAAVGRPQIVGADAVALGVVAVERPRDLVERALRRRRRGRLWLLLLGRDELLGRGAANVGGLLALVEDVPDREPAGEQDQRDARRDPLLHGLGSTAQTRE
jgi:hypothetical protein